MGFQTTGIFTVGSFILSNGWLIGCTGIGNASQFSHRSKSSQVSCIHYRPSVSRCDMTDSIFTDLVANALDMLEAGVASREMNRVIHTIANLYGEPVSNKRAPVAG